MHNLAVRLDQFMAKARLDDEAVAEAIGRDRSTISRLRRGAVKKPDAATLLLLDRWAEGVRRKKRWPAKFSLSWDHLLAASDDERVPA
jgi:transcriptional regulator with XRE-family HTH domain